MRTGLSEKQQKNSAKMQKNIFNIEPDKIIIVYSLRLKFQFSKDIA